MKAQSSNPVLVDDYMARIFKSKNLAPRALLLATTPTIDDRCKEYSEALPMLASIAKRGWTDDVHKALTSCYDSTTKELTKLKDSLLDALRVFSAIDVQRCPYCMLDEPNTWDHYLPNTHYPEYSVFKSNLVYVCFRCNHKKGAVCEDDRLLFCHPYFTVHPTVPVLHANIAVTGGDLKILFYVAGPVELAPYVEIATQHIKRLDLSQRFGGESSSVVSSLVAELRLLFPKGIEQGVLATILNTRYQAVDIDFGPNAWEARLWHGLGACPHFFEYVNTQIVSMNRPSREGFELVLPPIP